MNRKQRDLLLRRIGALVLIFVFLFAGILTSQPNTGQQGGATPTLQTTSGVVFPTIPPGGTSVVADYTYFHPSGVISLPHLVGWDPAGTPDQPAEERAEPFGTSGAPGSSQITRVGITFINGTALSVIHTFAEKNPERKLAALQDLDKYYDANNLKEAWAKFTGGWKELNRKAEGNAYVINFELYLDTNTYLGRQVSRFEGEWLMVMRLVVPGNNPQLLNLLQESITPRYQLWPQALSAPLNWAAVGDYVAGYAIKYPPDWRVVDGGPGRPYTISGTLGPDSITLTTRSEPGKAVKTEDEVRAWIKANVANANVQTVKADNRGDTIGFSVSYSNPDADGNQRSAVATLLNGKNGTLYVANLLSSARGQNLLDESNKAISPDLARVRNSFFTVPADQLVPTLTPSVTPQPSASAPTTGTPPAPALTATTVPTTAVPTTAPTTAIPTTVPTTVIPPTAVPTTAAPTATTIVTATATATATTVPTTAVPTATVPIATGSTF